MAPGESTTEIFKEVSAGDFVTAGGCGDGCTDGPGSAGAPGPGSALVGIARAGLFDGDAEPVGEFDSGDWPEPDD